MGQDVNVAYRTSKPRYVVQREYVYGTGCRVESEWSAVKSFRSLENAKEYADEQQSIFPDAQFRVVDTQPE